MIKKKNTIAITSPCKKLLFLAYIVFFLMLLEIVFELIT